MSQILTMFNQASHYIRKGIGIFIIRLKTGIVMQVSLRKTVKLITEHTFCSSGLHVIHQD